MVELGVFRLRPGLRTLDCRDKFEKVACWTDNGHKGKCEKKPVNTPDFSVPGPPKFTVIDTLVCVALPEEHPVRNLLYVVGGTVVALLLVVYNLFRKRSLSDYP